MTDAYTGEIRMFAGTFAPHNWTFCYGELMAISGDEALFSLLGTIYGGDGRSSFGIPDLRGRIPLHRGTGPGLTPRPQGGSGGTETVTLTLDQLPSHSHQVQCTTNSASTTLAQNALPGGVDSTRKLYDTSLTPGKIVDMNVDIVASEGDGSYHENMMPSLGVNFIICRTGLYPQRN